MSVSLKRATRALVFIAFFGAGSAFASEPCRPPSSAKDVVDCIVQASPSVRSGVLGVEQSKEGVGAAGMIPNPQFQAQYGMGKQLGDELMQTQLVLVQPIEWGGKRSSRVASAEAAHSAASADFAGQKMDARTQAILSLYRFNQLDTERATLEEAIKTYRTLASQYRKRPRLTPEQEIALGVFELAQSDYEIRLLTLDEEERALERFFAVSGGYTLEQIRKVYPEQPKVWPEAPAQSSQAAGSPELQRALADRELAEADLRIARAGAWPTLGFGPLVQFQSEGPIQGTLFGFQLNIDVPVFNLNGPGRAAARKGLERSEFQLETFRRSEALERQVWAKTYQDSRRLLSKMASPKTLERKHKQVESLFLRGVVPSGLVIEAHRQRVDFERSRHERTLRALEALWRVYRIDGVAFEKEPILP